MKNILCFGDSNTWGYNPENGSRRKWEERWTGILQKKIDSLDVGDEEKFRIVEEGLVGRTTVFEDAFRYGRKGSDFLPVALESSSPHAVILMLGTNDCKILYNATAEIIGKGIEILLDQIKLYSPNSKVLLVSPIHLGDNVEEKDPEFNFESVATSKELENVYKKIAKERNINFLAASDFANPSEEDLEHLDAGGHKELAEWIFNKFILKCL